MKPTRMVLVLSHVSFDLKSFPVFKEILGPFGFCFLNMFLRTVFENTENTKIAFSKNYSCSLNLVFFCVLCAYCFFFFVFKK